VKGRITTRNWDDQQGQRHYVTEIVADNVEFGRKPKGAGQDGAEYVPEEEVPF